MRDGHGHGKEAVIRLIRELMNEMRRRRVSRSVAVQALRSTRKSTPREPAKT